MRKPWLTFAAALIAALFMDREAQAQDKPPVEIVPQIGHSAHALAFSPNGQHAVSSDLDGVLKLWDVSTGRELRSFTEGDARIWSVAYSPSGNLVISVRQSILTLRDIATGEVLRHFRGHQSEVSSVAFSPDGRFVLSGSADKTLKLWEVSTGNELLTLAGHTSTVSTVAFSSDGRLALSGSYDHTLKLWDLSSGRELRSFNGHSDLVTSVVFSSNGDFALSGSFDRKLIVWDVATGAALRILGHAEPIWSIALSPDGQSVLSLSDGSAQNSGQLKLWDLATGRELREFSPRTSGARFIAFSPDGTYALSTGGRAPWLWDVATGQRVREFIGYGNAIWSVALSPDGRSALTASLNDTAQLWDLTTGRQLRNGIGRLGAITPDGRAVLSASGTMHTLTLRDILTGQELRDFTGHTDAVLSIAFSPDGRLALSGSSDRTLRLWDTETGVALRSFIGHDDAVTSVAFSPDGKTAVSGSHDKTLKFWDISTGRELRSLAGHDGYVYSVAFSPDGRFVLSGGQDKNMRLWEAATGLLRASRPHGDTVFCVAFSPDGRFVLSCDRSTLLLWDAKRGHLLRKFSGHRGMIKSIAFSPDGQFFISGSFDGTTRIWKTDGGAELASMIGKSDGEWLTIAPSGFFAASPGGAEIVGIVQGDTPHSVMQFYEHLYRPDLIAELLTGDAWGKYKDAASKLNLETILDSGPAPRLELLEKRTERAQDSVKLAVRIKDAGGGIGGKVVWRVNGRAQGELTAPGLQGLPSPGRAVTMSQELKVDAAKPTSVEVTAYNGQGLLASLPLQLTVDPFGVTTTERPKLHVLAAGIDKYAMKSLELRYAVKDAKAFTEAMQAVGSTLFSEVKITALHDDEVTKAKLEAAVNKLAGEVKPTDVFVLFLSGHGRSIAGKYYFLQQDLEFVKGHSIEHDAIGQDLWQAWLARIPAQKTLLIYDTCESAAASGLVRGGERERETAMEQLQHATGQNLIAAARQAAYEGYQGHGVLTYAMLEAFQKLDAGGEVQKVDVDGLARHVGDKVPELTKTLYGVRQEPLRKLAGNNFPLGLKILLPETSDKCPATEEFVVIRSEPLLDYPDNTAQSRRTLDPGFRVGANFVENWALICRDGAKLGYVSPASLLKTN